MKPERNWKLCFTAEISTFIIVSDIEKRGIIDRKEELNFYTMVEGDYTALFEDSRDFCAYTWIAAKKLAAKYITLIYKDKIGYDFANWPFAERYHNIYLAYDSFGKQYINGKNIERKQIEIKKFRCFKKGDKFFEKQKNEIHIIEDIDKIIDIVYDNEND
jgi:hypothetical protein